MRIPLPPMPPRPTPPRPRRWRWVALGLLLLALTGAGASWFYFRPRPPEPPTVRLEGAEPAVVRLIEEARQKVTENPTSADSWGELGKILYAHGYAPEAMRCFAEAEKLDPNESRWPYLRGAEYLLRDPNHALPLLRRAVELGHPTLSYSVAARLRLAEALMEREQTEEAETLLRGVLADDPNNARGCYDFGVLCATREDAKTAVDYLQRATRGSFARKRALVKLASVYTRLGNRSEAERAQQEAARLPDEGPWPDPYLSEVIQLEQGRLSRFQKVVDLQSAGRWEAAADILRDMARTFPDERTYVALGINLATQGKYPQAEEVLRTALKLAPEHVQVHYFLCVAIFLQSEKEWPDVSKREHARTRFAEAAEHAQLALKGKPDHGMARMFLGRAQRFLGDRPSGIANLREAVACRPDSSETILALGEALAEDGQVAEARRVLEAGLRVAGEKDPRLRKALERLPSPKPPG